MVPRCRDYLYDANDGAVAAGDLWDINGFVAQFLRIEKIA